jgi:hypothetical protein
MEQFMLPNCLWERLGYMSCSAPWGRLERSFGLFRSMPRNLMSFAGPRRVDLGVGGAPDGRYGPRSRERKLRNHAVQYSNLIVTTPSLVLPNFPPRVLHTGRVQRLLHRGSCSLAPPLAPQ